MRFLYADLLDLAGGLEELWPDADPKLRKRIVRRARLKSGSVLLTNTLDCFENAIQKPTDTLEKVRGDNPLTGPFYMEGALAGGPFV